MLQDDFIAIWNRIFKRSVWKVEEGLQYLDLYESAEKEERHDYTVPDSGRGCGWKSSGEREKLRFTDGGYGVLGDKQLLRMLEVLFSDEIQVEEKKWILEKEFKMPMTEELEGGVEEMCNLSKGVWEKGIEQGIEQGIERGLSRGVERGMRETVFSFVKKKMLKGKSLSQIAEELDESEEYLAPFYRLVQENPELSVKELALKA